MSYKSYEYAFPNRCQCGRHWDDHLNNGTRLPCPNPECCDGGVGYEDDPKDPARPCPVCKGEGVLPCCGKPGDEDACFCFVQDQTTNGEMVADMAGW